MSMSDSTGDPLIPYSPDLFADREKELDLVCSYVAQLARGSPPDRRVVRFYGVVGSGKTWLLRRLQETLGEKFSQMLVLRLCLIADPELVDKAPDKTYFPQSIATDTNKAVVSMLQWLIERVIRARGAEPAWVNVQTEPQDLAHRLQEELTDTGKPLVLLADGIDEQPAELVNLLESYCLVPLVKRLDALVILGMRMPPKTVYAWSGEIRLSGHDVVLGPFPTGDARDQLRRASGYIPSQAVDRADEIVRLGGGYPYNNVLLAQELDSTTGGWLDQAQALQKTADYLLSSVDAQPRPYFWALCVLREFDEHRMQALFQAYGVAEAHWATETQLSKSLRGELVPTRLVTWDEERRAYVMDGALRRALENALHATNQEKWQNLHAAARDLYRSWSGQYPRTADRWRKEMTYHEDCLKAGHPL